MEQGWDGCNVKASIDGGANWEIITPTGGYTDDALSTANACIPENPVGQALMEQPGSLLQYQLANTLDKIQSPFLLWI